MQIELQLRMKTKQYKMFQLTRMDCQSVHFNHGLPPDPSGQYLDKWLDRDLRRHSRMVDV